MSFKFDVYGHVVWTPQELYQMVVDNPRRLVNDYLMAGTPWAFEDYGRYRDFLHALTASLTVAATRAFLQ
jgi:hypothetical protein